MSVVLSLIKSVTLGTTTLTPILPTDVIFFLVHRFIVNPRLGLFFFLHVGTAS